MEEPKGNGLKIVGWLVVVLLVLWGASALFGGEKSPKETGPIKIGVIAPLTGDAAVYGQAVKEGVELALADINLNRDAGNKVEAIFEDGKCNGKDGASAAQKLVNIDGVKVIVGGSCSGETFGAAPITESAKVILLSPVSSAAKITDLGDYVFRNHPSDNEAGKQLAQYALKNYKKVAVFSENTDYAQGIRAVFNAEVKNGGGAVVFDESYNSDTNDFRSLVAKMKATGADVVFLCSQTGATASQLAKQVREQGIKTPFLTAYLTGPEFVKTGSSVEGTVIIDVPGLSSDEIGKKLVASYLAKYNREPNYKFFIGTSYDATRILVDAVSKVGSDTSKIKDYLYNLKNYTGSIGTYSLDSNGDVTGLNLVLRQVVNGEVVELK